MNEVFISGFPIVECGTRKPDAAFHNTCSRRFRKQRLPPHVPANPTPAAAGGDGGAASNRGLGAGLRATASTAVRLAKLDSRRPALGGYLESTSPPFS